MKLVTIYLPNGSKIKIECDRAQELTWVSGDGELHRGSYLTLEREGEIAARFTLQNIAGYQIEDVKDIKE